MASELSLVGSRAPFPFGLADAPPLAHHSHVPIWLRVLHVVRGSVLKCVCLQLPWVVNSGHLTVSVSFLFQSHVISTSIKWVLPACLMMASYQ